MSFLRAPFCMLALLTSLVATSSCGGDPAETDRLSVAGELDRESIEGTREESVVIDYASSAAIAEFWPCEMRLTAGACVGERHVNVYVALPGAVDLGDLGRTGCVQNPDDASGVLALFRRDGSGTYDIGVDLEVFVLVASDLDDEPGARLDSDEETFAATALLNGELVLEGFSAEAGATLSIQGTTRGGRDVLIEFAGVTQIPPQVLPLENGLTCDDAAKIE